ncbi:hypothetical protein PORY_000267 [Pneumocystis oryctolagi]|uniref:Uncharacterized protein n=1 Tax=Pneumocystis oryctolagi TaxID=42067 RepID=A0ACB7CET9_9ASCO|nr:hypothetical protein PORY_000267 [Pneumocystis oryctolagi]
MSQEDTDVFKILGELIEEQKKKHASLVSQQNAPSFNKSITGLKNDNIEKTDCFSLLELKTPNSPSSIKTYPSALRYIIRRIFWDSSLLKKISELIEEQANYEEKWWNDRQALIKNWEDKKKVNMASEENIEHELLLYDLRVHRAIQEIIKVQEKELQRLGVPFFINKNETNLENKKKVVQLLKDLVSD